MSRYRLPANAVLMIFAGGGSDDAGKAMEPRGQPDQGKLMAR
jgi:hypothetical protein